MIPKKPAPDLIRGGNRFSEKIMLEQKKEKIRRSLLKRHIDIDHDLSRLRRHRIGNILLDREVLGIDAFGVDIIADVLVSRIHRVKRSAIDELDRLAGARRPDLEILAGRRGGIG